jgi:hypothetical protein
LSNFIPSSVVEIAPRISSKEYQSRNFEVSQVFEETIGIDYLETRDIFCARSECVSVDSRNSILFSDSNHLTYAGAKLVVAELEKILSK